MTPSHFRTARALALGVPLALMAGALAFQYLGHLYPCDLCWWQRYPHYTAIPLAALAFVVPGRPLRVALVALAAVAILVSGGIGVFHAGIEYHWWQGLTECTSTRSGPVTLESILRAPIVRCDVPQWTFAGVSLAGFNAIFSIAGGLTILALLRSKRA